jgi:PadR family transcriptional regulator
MPQRSKVSTIHLSSPKPEAVCHIIEKALLKDDIEIRFCKEILYLLMASSTENSSRRPEQGLYSGFIRVHILYHACQGPVFGMGMMEELARHGYKLSAGTLYPLLHGLEKRGLLRSKEERAGRVVRRFYRATPAGRRALVKVCAKVEELLGEILEGNKLTSEKVK